MRPRCVSTFQLFLTFLKRACSPGAVKNSKISKNMKFLDVHKTTGQTMILRCPKVVFAGDALAIISRDDLHLTSLVSRGWIMIIVFLFLIVLHPSDLSLF